MLLSIEELRLRPVEFELLFAPARLTLSSAEEAEVDEVALKGRATLAGDGMRIEGHIAAAVHPLCARCAEPVTIAVDRSFDLLYQPDALMADAGEVEIHAPDAELGFFSGAGVELEDVVREQLLLALPMQAYCRPDCRGLCPRCGANLNQGPCGCPPQVDPRWHALQDLCGPN